MTVPQTQTKHTSGPFTAEFNDEMPLGFIFAPGSETLIAEMTSNGQSDLEVHATARLLASAPALADALREIARDVHFLGVPNHPMRWTDIRDTARGALGISDGN